MHKFFSLAVLGAATAGVTLATPGTSQAQTPFGISVDFGRGGFSYYQGRPGYYGGAYYGGAYAPGYGHGGSYGGAYYGSGYGSGYYGGGYGSGYGSGYYGGGYYGRPTIVHPEYYHFTPGRGWHSHGHMHVPHGGHYHTYRY
jgi:hypothetical protein